MNIIVCAKQVIDISEMKIDSSTKKPILQGVPQKISDIDKNAMEEAIKIKEKQGGKLTVVTIGPSDAKERIKELLAMGADEGVLVTAPDNIDYYMTATLLAEAIKKIGAYDLILCGRQAIDGDTAQVGPQLAESIDLPQITYAQKIEIKGDGVRVERELEDGYEVIEAKLPLLITCIHSINEPRYATLQGIDGSFDNQIDQYDQLDVRLMENSTFCAGLSSPPLDR